jgi:hypothetical protein
MAYTGKRIPLARPICPKCGNVMLVSRRLGGYVDNGVRVFACQCGVKKQQLTERKN